MRQLVYTIAMCSEATGMPVSVIYVPRVEVRPLKDETRLNGDRCGEAHLDVARRDREARILSERLAIRIHM